MMHRRIWIAALIVAVLALSGAMAAGAPGDLDTTFGQDGKATIDVGGVESAQAQVVQPDGKIVIVGAGSIGNNALVARLTANGALDTTFDGDGVRSIDSGGNEFARAVALQPDGKVLVAGQTFVGGLHGAVYRINPDGTDDTTFGSDGQLTVAGGRTEAIGLQSDGKIVLAGFATTPTDALVLRLLGYTRSCATASPRRLIDMRVARGRSSSA